MPYYNTETLSNIAETTVVSDLSGSRKKARQHRREAHALMGVRKVQFEQSQAKQEALVKEIEDLGKELGVLAELLKQKGITQAQIDKLIS